VSVRIFLSTVSDEFRDYRDQLRHDLTRHNVEVKVQEDFKDLGSVTLDKLDVYIAACGAVVHLVGDMTGAPAKAESTRAIVGKYDDLMNRLPPLRQPLENRLDISYTQWEAWLALYHDKLLLIAKADDTAPRGPQFAPTDASRAAQRLHLERLRAFERYPGCTFTSPDNLAKQILSGAILDLLAREVDRTQGNVTVTFSGGCNLGATPAELQDLISNVLARRAVSLELHDNVSRALGVTDTAVTNFFRILGENKVATEDLDAKLREVAARHLASGLADIVGRHFCFWRITSISQFGPNSSVAPRHVVASAGYQAKPSGAMG
jgi:hypothetical protein